MGGGFVFQMGGWGFNFKWDLHPWGDIGFDGEVF